MEHLEVYLAIRKEVLSPRFFSSVNAVLRELDSDLDVPSPAHVTTEMLQLWANAKLHSVKASSLESYVTWIRRFFDWCVAKELSHENPALGISLPRSRKPFRRNFLLKRQVTRLISECLDSELRYCLYCGLHAGLRLNEVVMSRPEWFDLDAGLLHITQGPNFETKDRDDRTIPLTEEFRAFLVQYGLREPYMIAAHKSEGKVYRVYFRKRFVSYIASKGIAMSFHDCRRTFASLLVSEGVSIYKVAKWLGDGVQVVERHYGHLIPADPQINLAFSTKAA